MEKDDVYIKDLSVVAAGNMKRLVIVDDAMEIYKRYKKNTYRIREWTKNKKDDDELSECLEVLE